VEDTIETQHGQRSERRQYIRRESTHPVSYVCIDENGREIGEGMGTTLNLSSGGALLETFFPVKTPYVLLLSFDLEDSLIELRGEVVHCEQLDAGAYHVGIRFEQNEEKGQELIARLLETVSHPEET
jgi:hypothetical protein